MTKYIDGVDVQYTSSLPELNHALLEECVSWAYWSAQDDKTSGVTWNQGRWVFQNECGTSFCIAGYASFASGHTEMREPPLEETCQLEDCVNCQTKPGVPALHVTGLDLIGWDRDASTMDEAWCEMGEKLLGLTSNEADALFDGSNSIEDVLEITEKICSSRGLPMIDVNAWQMKKVVSLENGVETTKMSVERVPVPA